MQALQEFDWNFEAVPDEELGACCYWEYARESMFILGVRERCIESSRKGFHRSKQLGSDLDKIHTAGPAIEVVMSGFYSPPDEMLRIDAAKYGKMTNSFPAAWQCLPPEERDFRMRTLLKAGWSPGAPFERADHLDAKDIAENAEAKWNEIMSVYHRVRREDPHTSEVILTAQGKLPPFTGIPVSILREDGKEITTVAINWARFTNDEIVKWFRKWVKGNRPKEIQPFSYKGRNKARDRRVILERLAITRLLHHYPLRDMPKACPAGWKLYRKREWYKERKRAGVIFHRLFPFLPKSEQPLCWETKGGRSK